MKFDNKMLLIIFIAALFLIWYIIHPFIIEGAIGSVSAETKLKTMNKALSEKKFNENTNDIKILGQKIELLKQRSALLKEMLNHPKIANSTNKQIQDEKAPYQKLLTETDNAIPVVQSELAAAKAALTRSRQKT